MRVDLSRLTFHALCVLEDEARRATREGRLRPSAAVRLALGYLYAISRDDRGVDPAHASRTYWEYLTREGDVDTHTSAGFGRWQMMNSCLNAIATAAGMPRDHKYEAARSQLLNRREREEMSD